MLTRDELIALAKDESLHWYEENGHTWFKISDEQLSVLAASIIRREMRTIDKHYQYKSLQHRVDTFNFDYHKYSESNKFRWISVTQCLPEFDESLKVFVYTEGSDFQGQQFFHLRATDLYNDANGESISEVAEHVTHWCCEVFP